MMYLKGFGRNRSYNNIRYYPGIFLKELRKAMGNLGIIGVSH
jgi:hypothetical protein